MGTDKEDRCDVCRHSGLAMFFVRWGAIPNDSRLAPASATSLETDATLTVASQLPSIQKSRYVLRVLRPGYLHVYHETPLEWKVEEMERLNAANPPKTDAQKKARAEKTHWEVLRVTPSGAMIPESHASFKLDTDFQCKTEGHIFTAMTYRLRNAHSSGKIWVAFSANLWNSAIRQKNKANADVMSVIDVPSVLAGTLPKNAVSPNGKWIDKNVAEFGLPDFTYGGLKPTLPFTSHRAQGVGLVTRMGELDGLDKQTKGKSFVCILPDPAGTATDLADISQAQFQKGLDYIEENRQFIGTANRLKDLEANTRRVEEFKLKEKPMRGLRMTDVLRVDARGRTTMANGEILDVQHGHSGENQLQYVSLPVPDNRVHWEYVGDMPTDVYMHLVLTGEIPKSACIYPYLGRSVRGPVFAPVVEMDEKRLRDRTQDAMSKINRLHRSKDMAKYVKGVNEVLNVYQTLVDGYDADRAQWLGSEVLNNYFSKHFDPDVDSESESRVHSTDACNVLISWGGVSRSLKDVASKLVYATPGSMHGWAIASLMGNRRSIYSTYNPVEYAVDWVTSSDAKLDKTYDSLKFALFDVKDGLLVAKHAWLKPSGIGLSFGLMGFIGGAATYLLGNAFEEEYPGAAKNAQDALNRMQQFVDGKTGSLKGTVAAKELKMATAVENWCNQMASLLKAHLDKMVPERPVLVRVSLTLEQATEVLIDMQGQRTAIAQRTRQVITEWRRLPDSVRGRTIDLDFLTTDRLLAEAEKIEISAATGGGVTVVTRQTARASVSVSLVALGDMYRKSCRFEQIGRWLESFAKKVAPNVAGVVTKAAMAVPKIAAGAGRGAITWQGQFSFWGAMLQWRGMLSNEAKLANLQQELEKIPNLTVEQKAAINDEMTLVRFGLLDNWAGVVGGLSEMSAIGVGVMKFTGVEAMLKGVAAFGGAVGAYANAEQNWLKAAGKRREGEDAFALYYGGVAAMYNVASTALGLNATAIIAQWIIKRFALRVGITVTDLIIFGVKKLPYVGWGLTIFAFLIEGVVNWFSRTKMEEWVEASCFGDMKYKNWQAEEAAYEKAERDMQEQALRQADGTLPEEAK